MSFPLILAKVVSRTLGVAAVLACAGALGSKEAHAREGRPATVSFGAGDAPRAPEHRAAPTRSFHLTMRDGVRVAVDLTLPDPLPSGPNTPAVLHLTRYWRDVALRLPVGWLRDLVQGSRYESFFPRFGYAVLKVDARGSGASFGTQLHPWDPDEIADYGEVIDWVVAQPWSNGRIGAMGASYAGTAAELAASTGRSALRAVVPRFVEFDLYTDNAFPGGIFHEHFVRNWSALGRELDANRVPDHPLVPWFGRFLVKGVKPVDGDTDGRLLAAAVAEHSANGDLFGAGRRLEYRDQRDPATNVGIDDFSLHRHRSAIERSGVAIFAWGGWLDGASANGVLQHYLTFTNPQRVVIGAWSHVALHDADPFAPEDAPVEPPIEAQWHECLRFFDTFVRDGEDPATLPREITYFTMGERRWKRTASWPPPGVRMERLHLAAGRRLVAAPPGDATGADDLRVDFHATTGLRNRWHTLLDDGDVSYGDRARADAKRLTWTSEPLPHDVEITGSPLIHLQLRSTEPDAALYVYLEAVEPSGRSTYVTEGQLRLVHHALSTSPPPYTAMLPYRTFTRGDARPVEPGELVEVTLGMLPTSVRLRRATALRLAIAGHDADTFRRIPRRGTPRFTIERNAAAPSWLELPIAGAGLEAGGD